jgi:ADP-heptose:LPS heptosyltransferase
MMQKKIKFIETKTTADLIEVIKRCALLIGNDSGPVHIANLLGKPTFTIYGPTNPDFHKPLDGINKYIIKEIPCSPRTNEKMCFTYGGMIGCPSFECMNNLNVEEVKTSVDDFILSLEKMKMELHT